MAQLQRVAILGAGSVGCFIGGTWVAAGLPVTFIGRQRLAADVNDYGLTLSDYSGWREVLEPSDVDFRCSAEALSEADIILVTVKSGDTDSASAEIARHGAPGSVVISFQNGVSNVDRLAERLGDRFDVLRGMVPYNVAYLGQGRFHKGVPGTLYTEQHSFLAPLSDLVHDGPAALRSHADMLGLAWGKLLINLNNAVNALSGRTLQDELRRRDYRRVFAASIVEGLELLAAARIEPASVGPISIRQLPRIIKAPDWLFNSVFLKRWKIDAKARSSMADDLAAGRTTEVDYLNGELVRLAEQLGKRAPVNERIVNLVRGAESGAPPLSPRDLRRKVFGA